MTTYQADSVAGWVARCEAALEDSGAWFGHGTDNATDEAAWLVLHVLGLPLDGSFEQWEQVVPPRAAGKIQALLNERLSSRKPLAYLLGEAWFCGLKFRVTKDVLVPRSPMAELIAAEFRPWVRPEQVRTHRSG